MTLPRTAADVLAEHVLFKVECIDRIPLAAFEGSTPTAAAPPAGHECAVQAPR